MKDRGVSTDFTKLFEERESISHKDATQEELNEGINRIKYKPSGYKGEHQTEPMSAGRLHINSIHLV